MKPQRNMSIAYGVLNCTSEDSVCAAISEKRHECVYSDLSGIFRQHSKDFSKQFAHIYAVRLSSMKESIKKKVLSKWGKDMKICTLVELQEIAGEKCVVIGTIFVDQKLKPSILKEISEEAQLVPQPSRNNFVSKTDTLILEDELQRIVLQGALDVHKVVTGVVCAVLGHEDLDSGKFQVEDYCWAGVTSVPSPISPPDTDQYVVLVSGLDLAGGTNLLQLQLMVDWLSGFLGEPHDQQQAARVVRLIIAGNSIRSSEEKDEKVSKTTTIDNTSSSLTAVQLLDNFLSQLVQFMDVDIMPGEFDPTNHTLPQQPLHYCMFPKSSRFESLHGVTNPYCCMINGRRVTGTSGQPVDDISRYSKLTEPVDILRQTLEWGHISPTSPDTLACYPFYEEDPFILGVRPDIYFAGNQPSFQTAEVEHTNGGGEVSKLRLVCVPCFGQTSTCVLVNLRTLHCQPMTFGTAIK